MSTDEKQKMIIEKAARLAIMLELDTLGLLDDLSYQKIANLLAGDEEPVNRSTILRDKRDLQDVRNKINQIYRTLGWKKRR